MSSHQRKLSQVPPGPLGRAARIGLGIAGFLWLATEGIAGVGTAGFVVVFLLALSLLVGGVNSNPGCEITALPNLFLLESEQVNFV